MSGPRALPAIGLAVVGIAAAVLSYSALADLAAMVGTTIPALYPVAVDAALAVSTAIWLGGAPAAGLTPARRFARTMTWALLVATVAGNALHQGLRSAGLDAPWWVAVLVGAVPPAVLGATVHLAVLVGRTESPATGEEPKVDQPVKTVRPAEPERPAPIKTVRPAPDRPAKSDRTDAEILAALAEWSADPQRDRPPVRGGRTAGYPPAGRVPSEGGRVNPVRSVWCAFAGCRYPALRGRLFCWLHS